MTCKILVVEDDEFFLTYFLIPSLKYLVNENDIDIIFARNGFEAFILFEQYTPDIIVTDYEMPIMNGKELLHKINDHNHKPKKTFLISNHPKVQIEQYTTGFIRKDSIFKTFFKCVENGSISLGKCS